MLRECRQLVCCDAFLGFLALWSFGQYVVPCRYNLGEAEQDEDGLGKVGIRRSFRVYTCLLWTLWQVLARCS